MNFRRKMWLGTLIMFMALFWMSSSALSKRAPDVHFVPTPQEAVTEMLQAAGVGPNDVVYDLGCGDGRFVITAVQKFGARKGVGIDIDPVRIRESKENALQAGVIDRTIFYEGDLFEADIREATVVTLYLLPSLNLKLLPIFFRDLRPGTRIVSYVFDMGDWKADFTGKVGHTRYYHWIMPANVAGNWNVTFALQGQTQEYSLDLTQKYQEVAGSARARGQALSLSEPRLRGDRLSFVLHQEVDGKKVTMNFEGMVSGDRAGGEVKIDGSVTGRAGWVATRKTK